MEKLIIELKQKVVDVLMLTNIKPADIREDEPLFGGELEIDSIDVLELVMMVQVFVAAVNVLAAEKDLQRTKDSNANSSLW